MRFLLSCRPHFGFVVRIPGAGFFSFDKAGLEFGIRDIHIDRAHPAANHQRRDDVGRQVGRGADLGHEPINPEQKSDARHRYRIHHRQRRRQGNEAATGHAGRAFGGKQHHEQNCQLVPNRQLDIEG